jgi:hypothetical protein
MPRPGTEPSTTNKRAVYQRDGGQCRRCHAPVAYDQAEFDPIDHSPMAPWSLSNLIVLCRRCSVLRIANGLGRIGSALDDGLIPADWRPLAWDDAAEPEVFRLPARPVTGRSVHQHRAGK